MSLVPVITCEDAMDWLAARPDGSVDLFFVDPVFNIGYAYDDFKDKKTPLDYVEWCQRWIAEAYRVLKPNGTLWICSGDKYVSFIDVAAQVGIDMEGLRNKKRRMFNLRSHVIWSYTFGQNLPNNFTKSHTHLLYFTKHAKNFVWNGDDPEVRHASARQLVYKDKRANAAGRLPDATWHILESQIMGKLEPFDDVWLESRVAGTFKSRVAGQSCQMPEPILERVIRLCSNPGDLVCDFFLGSGTTCAVARRLGRRSAGCDISPTSVERARRLCGIEPV